MTMKKTGIIVMMAAMLLCCLPAQAQLGGLINKGKKVTGQLRADILLPSKCLEIIVILLPFLWQTIRWH